MKKMNNKGFTIVELVIVIAVIAILAAVMIPTFSGIVAKAQMSAATQEITAAYKEAYANALGNDGIIATDETASAMDFTFKFNVDASNKLTCVPTDYPDNFGFSGSYADGTWTLVKTGTPNVDPEVTE